jgi:pseudoazurin
MTWKMVVAVLVGSAVSAAPAMAKDIMVAMKNKGSAGIMVFEPAFVQAAVGDKIHFMPTDPSHNAEPIPDMLPAGVTAGVGAMNKEYVLLVSKPGLYGIKCKPHFSMGMVALIKAGTGAAPNYSSVEAAAGKLPALAQKRFGPMLKSVR